MKKKTLKQKEWIVSASETIFYELKVKAKTVSQAEKLVRSGNIDINYKDAVDSAGFEITSIEPNE